MPDIVQQIPADRLDLGNAPRAIEDYKQAIADAILNHPRSQQSEIGPSEVGISCDRRIGYKLLGHPEPQKVNWKATVGTAIHAWLETVFDGYNLDHAEFAGEERYLIENRVSAGPVPFLGYELEGSCDLYDRVTGIVIDHKTISPSQLKKYRSQGPSQQYRAQAHIYGYAWRRAGFAVTAVAIAFLPRNGELTEAYIWSEPYDEQVALDAMARLAGIAQVTRTLGAIAPTYLPTSDAYCPWCPFFKAGSTDPAVACPGHPGSVANTPPQSALTLVG